MKKLFLIFFGAAALSFQSCKQGTPDADKTIDDGMQTSETAIGSGTTRPEDQNAANNNNTATAPKPSGIDDGYDTVNTEAGSGKTETTQVPRQNDERNAEVSR